MRATSFSSPQQIIVATLLVTAGLTGPANAQSEAGSTNPSSMLVILKDQPARQILTPILSPPSNALKQAETDLHLAPGQVDAGQRVASALLAAAKQATAAIQLSVKPEQDYLAARLAALGATNIRRYTAINMLAADLPGPALDTVKQWQEVSEVIPVGTHQALIDQIEQYITNPTAPAGPVIDVSDEAFLRLADRVIDDRDALLAAAAGVSAFNALPASSYSVAALSSVGTFSHLPVKAVQLSGPNSNYFQDSVSNALPFRFHVGHAPGTLNATLAWDRHFGDGLQPVLRNLSLTAYSSVDGSVLASASIQNSTVQSLSLSGGGDLVAKTKLESQDDNSATEPFALAISGSGFLPAQGPKLSVICATDCTVSNSGDLAALNVVATAQGIDYPLGTIAADGIAKFTPNQKVTGATVTSRSYGEIFTADATDPCTGTWQVSPASLVLNSSNLWNASALVTPPAGCATPWLAWPGPGPNGMVVGVVSPAGTVSGPNTVTVEGDPTLHVPTGTIYITKAELTSPYASFSVSIQPAPSCTYTASANGSLTPTYAGGTVSVSVVSQSACASSVADDSPAWLTIAGPPSGIGNWSASFTASANVQPNQGSIARTANLTVSATGGYSSKFTVQQSGLACSFTPGSLTLPAAGIPQTAPLPLTLTTNAGCQWTAVSTSTFVHVVTAANGIYTNSGTVQYWADANTTGAKRPGYVQIGGQTSSGDQDAQPNTPVLTIAQPAAGDTLFAGDKTTVAWTGAQKGAVGNLILNDRNGKQVAIQNGVALDTTVSTDWTIVLPGTATGAGFTVTIVSAGKVVATSGVFSITPRLAVSKPSAGDVVLLTKNGKSNPLVVVWTYNGPAGITGQIDLIDPAGKLFTLSAKQALQASTKSISSTIPAAVTPDSGYTIRITPSDGTPAVSSGAFSILSELAISSPSNNPAWVVGSTYTVTVTGSGLTVNVYALVKNGTANQKIALKTAEAVPAGGLDISWTVPADLSAGDYLIHAEELSNSNGQAVMSAFHVLTQTFTVKGNIKVPAGTQFVDLAGCAVTIQPGSTSVPCNTGAWSAQLNRADSSGKEISYTATVARTDYSFSPAADTFTATYASQPSASYDFPLTTENATVTAVGSNGLSIPRATLTFHAKTSVDVIATALLDSPSTWKGQVPTGAIVVTATAPGGAVLFTANFLQFPVLTHGVVFVGSAYSASGTIQVGNKVNQSQIAAAFAAVQSVKISFTGGTAQPVPELVADPANHLVRWTAYGFDTNHQYRAVATQPSDTNFVVSNPLQSQPIDPKSGVVTPFDVQPAKQ